MTRQRPSQTTYRPRALGEQNCLLSGDRLRHIRRLSGSLAISSPFLLPPSSQRIKHTSPPLPPTGSGAVESIPHQLLAQTQQAQQTCVAYSRVTGKPASIPVTHPDIIPWRPEGHLFWTTPSTDHVPPARYSDADIVRAQPPRGAEIQAHRIEAGEAVRRVPQPLA